MKFLGFSLLLFFGVVAFGAVLIAGIIKLVSQAIKDAVSVFNGGKKSQSKTYYYGDNFRREQEDENITVIDAEIVKDSLLKPYIADVKSAGKNNSDEEIKKLLNELTDILQSMDSYIANHRDKEELMDTIKMITDAFSTVLSEFYDNMALNTSSSLEALKASIKMKGYVK